MMSLLLPLYRFPNDHHRITHHPGGSSRGILSCNECYSMYLFSGTTGWNWTVYLNLQWIFNVKASVAFPTAHLPRRAHESPRAKAERRLFAAQTAALQRKEQNWPLPDDAYYRWIMTGWELNTYTWAGNLFSNSKDIVGCPCLCSPGTSSNNEWD